MIAGEIEFLAIAGSTTASAAIGGADVLSMALINDRLLTSLVVGPAIQKPEDLKGKSIGISRFGTSIDTAARIAIQHYGLEPIKDVSLVQVGAVSSAVASLRGGRIHGGDSFLSDDHSRAPRRLSRNVGHRFARHSLCRQRHHVAA